MGWEVHRIIGVGGTQNNWVERGEGGEVEVEEEETSRLTHLP